MNIQNVIFKAVDKVTSAREADGSYQGNSHHLSQEITTEVVAALKKENILPLMSVAPGRHKCESEMIAQNIMIILKRTGNKFRPFSWEEYKAERLKDGNFGEGEKEYFNKVIGYCRTEDTARLFSPKWMEAKVAGAGFDSLSIEPVPVKKAVRKIRWRESCTTS